MKLSLNIMMLCLIAVPVAAQHNQGDQHAGVHKVIIAQVIQTTSYTYVLAEEAGKKQWIAVPKMDVSEGETYYYYGGIEMRDFQSKELGQTFESVLFLNGLITPETVEDSQPSLSMSNQMTKEVQAAKQEVNIDRAKDGLTIAELYSEKQKYNGKVVRIRGKVTKYNAGIMNRNWVHLQDGTGDVENFDLTVTTDEEVRVGEIITFEGIISLDKDFGAGYLYEVIMESGKLVNK